ncbi:4-diphosphocytidyl-2-C-methyl-D-erythritol kinase [Sphingomonas guangdongensis]|uniref:4-diphosphocytidyl-2-C-methyl-D-erythritol kinase n=1 Tax=Sphingomonas guangdongensis TaxID=1141890 RepID=A0A285R069_9SPHN|nr:4-(cytidine 5'-diphospho)-2-C-methyl-D-erythritol kinase [Sphingomonas guangdongensis]SOB87510.1 4-diphosphocytidyl-2-C-methyl-D-erythritol kinase [Sphingomonas guangdongensis]
MIVELAPAKLNLALHVRARRADGYHELETLFAFVADGDQVTLAPAERESFVVTGPFASSLAQSDDNLVTRAARLFAETVAPVGPLAITLDKRLPVASGIGGGSADAAATLRALARMSGVAHDDPRLVAAAERLGSDVPACLLGLTARGGGRGERLDPVAGLAGTPVLLVNPLVAVSTAAVFARWDGIDRGPLPAGNAAQVAAAGRNDLTVPAKLVAPVIGEVIDVLDGLGGARLVRMSGSGATCFALFDTTADRAAGRARLSAAYPGWWCLETALT